MKQYDFCIVRNSNDFNYEFVADTVKQAIDFVIKLRSDLVNPVVEVCVGEFPIDWIVVDVITDF